MNALVGLIQLQAGGAEPSPFSMLVPMLAIFLIFWLLLIRPQQRRQREQEQMLKSIEKGDSVVTAGGLHVLMTERHDAARIDRQLAGRCARQGDPGVFQAMLSMEDDLLAPSRLPLALRGVRRLALAVPALRGWFARRAQSYMEHTHARARHRLMLAEHQLDRVLAFTGTRE